MAETGKTRSDIAGIVTALLVLAILCLSFLGGCSSSSSSDEEEEEEEEAANVPEGTQSFTSDWLSIEVPGNWTEEYVISTDDAGNRYIDESKLSIDPDDFTGSVYITETKEIGGIYEEQSSSIESSLIYDGYSVEEFTIDGAVARRYEVTSGPKFRDETSKGFIQYIYSGSEYKRISIYCVDAEYDEHAEEMIEVLDSITLRNASAPEDVVALAQTTLTDDGIPIAESLPYEGMDVKFIDLTWLGEHDGTETDDDETQYYWLADNDTGDRVFTAYVVDGVVDTTFRNNAGTNYWKDEEEDFDYPDLDASGEDVKRDYGDDDDDSSANITLEDPLDYNTPEEYADNAYKDFEALGYDDPWDAAFEYWEDNAG